MKPGLAQGGESDVSSGLFNAVAVCRAMSAIEDTLLYHHRRPERPAGDDRSEAVRIGLGQDPGR